MVNLCFKLERELAWLLLAVPLKLVAVSTSCFSLTGSVFSVCVSLWQRRNWALHRQQRIQSQRQIQEQHRLQQAQQVDRDRQLLSSLRENESFERRRYLRQVQEELKEREEESTLVQVGSLSGVNIRVLTSCQSPFQMFCVKIPLRFVYQNTYLFVSLGFSRINLLT